MSVAAIVVTDGLTPFLSRALAALPTQGWDRCYIANHGAPLPAVDPLFTEVQVTARDLGAAVDAVLAAIPEVRETDYLWLLHDDCLPQPGCLAHLLRAMETTTTVAIAAPMQVGYDDPTRVVEVGISATRSGARLARIEPGELDQGQHDATSDVLAVGTAGMLIATRTWMDLGGTTPALSPWLDGLDLGRRAHLAGHRVICVPQAKMRHAKASYLGLRDIAEAEYGVEFGAEYGAEAGTALVGDARASLVERAKAHRFLHASTLAAPLLPLFVLWWIISAFPRALWALILKDPTRARSYFAALGHIFAHPLQLGRARRLARRHMIREGARLAGLEAKRSDIRTDAAIRRKIRRDQAAGPPLEAVAAANLRVYRARARVTCGLGALLAAALVAVIYFNFAGGISAPAWLDLPTRYSDLLRAATSDFIALGYGADGPLHPFWLGYSILSAPLFWISPATLAFLVFILSPLLCYATGWIGSRIVSRALPTRILIALMWAAGPQFYLFFSTADYPALVAAINLPLVIWGLGRAAGLEAPIVVSGLHGPVAIPPRPTRIRGWAIAGCCALGVATLTPGLTIALIIATLALIGVQRRAILLWALPPTLAVQAWHLAHLEITLPNLFATDTIPAVPGRASHGLAPLAANLGNQLGDYRWLTNPATIVSHPQWWWIIVAAGIGLTVMIGCLRTNWVVKTWALIALAVGALIITAPYLGFDLPQVWLLIPAWALIAGAGYALSNWALPRWRALAGEGESYQGRGLTRALAAVVGCSLIIGSFAAWIGAGFGSVQERGERQISAATAASAGVGSGVKALRIDTTTTPVTLTVLTQPGAGLLDWVTRLRPTDPATEKVLAAVAKVAADSGAGADFAALGISEIIVLGRDTDGAITYGDGLAASPDITQLRQGADFTSWRVAGPLPGPVADPDPGADRGWLWGWRLLLAVTACAYLLALAPIGRARPVPTRREGLVQ